MSVRPPETAAASVAEAPPPITLRGLVLGFAAVAALTVALVVSRREILDWPPYWDFIIGLWVEANYLSDTGFDYDGLWNRERPIFEGGARCYAISVMPTVVAVLMQTLPTPRATLIAYHVFAMVCGALIVVLVFDLLRRSCGPLVAALAAAGTLATPLFSAQVEMLGMDMPHAAAAMLAVWLIDRGRPGLALVAGLCAFAIKATGLLIVLSLAAYCAVRLVARRFDARGRRDEPWAATMVAALGLAAGCAAVIAWGSRLEHQFDQSHRVNDLGLAGMRDWCPDLLLIFAAIALLGTIVLAVWLVRRPAGRTLVSRAAELVNAHGTLIFAAVLGSAILASITRIIFLPRYLLPAVPLAFILLAVLLLAVFRRRSIVAILLTVILAVAIWNQDGRLFPDLVDVHGPRLARTGALLERSLEYRADQRSNMAAVAALEAIQPRAPIFAPWPYPHMLALPRLGYVARPLSGYSTNGFSLAFPAFRDIEQAAFIDRPTDFIVVDVGNTFSEFSTSFRLPTFQPSDTPIYRDALPSPLVVFPVHLDLPRGSRELEDWYLDRLWPSADPARRAIWLSTYLDARGRRDRALAEVRRARAIWPDDRPLLLEYLRLLCQAGNWLEAARLAVFELVDPATGDRPPRKLFQRTLYIPGLERPDPARFWAEAIDRSDASTPPARALWALALLVSGDRPGAANLLNPAGAPDLPDPLACLILGTLDQAEGHANEALARFELARRLAPDDPQPAAALGGVYLAAGRLDEAVRELRSAIEMDPSYFLARSDLAIALARQQRWSEALDAARSAAAARPEDASLARIVQEIEANLAAAAPPRSESSSTIRP